MSALSDAGLPLTWRFAGAARGGRSLTQRQQLDIRTGKSAIKPAVLSEGPPVIEKNLHRSPVRRPADDLKCRIDKVAGGLPGKAADPWPNSQTGRENEQTNCEGPRAAP